MPFGLKLAGYAAALQRSRERLVRLRREALVLQFGGAVGTLAALGERGLEVSERLAARLGLPLPDAPWHSHRDRLAELASALAILAGSCGKIARDVTLLMQTDVGEAFEPAGEGRGGSSTMPHKRNPVGAVAVLAAAQLAPQLAATVLAAQVQEHERATGGWQAEWPTFPALLLAVSAALHGVAEIAGGLTVDGERMRRNLDTTHGLVMAEALSFGLAETLGKQQAHALVEELSRIVVREGRHLRDVAADDPRVRDHLSAAEIARLCDPLGYQGVAQQLIDRQLASAARRR
jgi:3-carboxy-cis,cis-muconate cycloisomerase